MIYGSHRLAFYVVMKVPSIEVSVLRFFCATLRANARRIMLNLNCPLSSKITELFKPTLRSDIS